MSKAKKDPQPTAESTHEKGFLALAGEAFTVLGKEIVEGMDKVIEVAAAKITSVKKAINKIKHKKAAAPRKAAPKKTASKKSVSRKAGSAAKKTANSAKPVKKVAKKVVSKPKKAAKKGKAVPRKATRK